MKKILYILTFLLILTTTYSQKEYYNWFFGNGALITFNTPDREPVYADRLNHRSLENTSSVSDKNGKLMFYAYGTRLYNNKHEEIGGDSIYGNTSSLQAGSLIRINDYHYVLVSSNFDRFTSSDGRYNLLTSLNIYVEGDSVRLGDTKTLVFRYRSESLQIFKNLINNDIYLISSTMSDEGKSVLNLHKYQDSNFILLKSFIIEQNHPYHYLKYNVANQLLVGTNIENGEIHFYRFNLENKSLINVGKFSNGKSDTTLSVEFSPNGKYLYNMVKEAQSTSIYQMGNLHQISEQQLKIEKVIDSRDYNVNLHGQMLLGPNGKIYISNPGHNSLSSINKPDNYLDIEFVERAVDLKNTHCLQGLPNMPTSFYNMVGSDDTLNVCLGANARLSSEFYGFYGDTVYIWEGPNNFYSFNSSPIIRNVTQNDEGIYTLEVKNLKNTIKYNVSIYLNVVNVDEEIKIVNKSRPCPDEPIILSLDNRNTNVLWSTGENTNEIIVTKPGNYSVEFLNEHGCEGFSEIDVVFEEKHKMNIIEPTRICGSSEEVFSADRDYETYLWSTGEKTKSISISKTGTYWLEVSTADDCKITDTIDITFHPNLIAELKPVPTTVCSKDSVLLESKYNSPNYEYLWNTNETTKSIYASKTGTYKLKITDILTGCTDSTEIAISVEDNLQPTIDGMNICGGNPATLEALPNDPSYSYEWSNGATTPTIVVNQPGTYTLTVSKDGCTGEAEFTVNESPNPEFEILGEDIVCDNTATLSPDEEFVEYLWSTDEVTKEIEVTEPGTYSLTITDEYGCQATEEFTVNLVPLSFDIIGGDIFCGSSTTLSPDKDFVEY